MTCKHGQEGECQRCEYEADMAVNPKAWEWWETLLWNDATRRWEWVSSPRIYDDDWDVFEIRRSPSAPDRGEWVNSNPRDFIPCQFDKCATCRHDYEKKGE